MIRESPKMVQVLRFSFLTCIVRNCTLQTHSSQWGLAPGTWQKSLLSLFPFLPHFGVLVPTLFPLCSHSCPTLGFLFLLCSHFVPTLAPLWGSCSPLCSYSCLTLGLLLPLCSHFVPILAPLWGSCSHFVPTLFLFLYPFGVLPKNSLRRPRRLRGPDVHLVRIVGGKLCVGSPNVSSALHVYLSLKHVQFIRIQVMICCVLVRHFYLLKHFSCVAMGVPEVIC